MRWTVPPGGARSGALEALLERFPALAEPAATPLAERFAHGEVVDGEGTPWTAGSAVAVGDELWFHRELRPEHVPEVPLPVLLHDEHLLVVDKPAGTATMPRGAHVLASALARLRRSTGITTLTPLHRLDRRTRGVLALGVRPEERSAYQGLFAAGEVRKEYRARVGPGGSLPTAVGERALLEDRLQRTRGELRTRVVRGAPNAVTELEVLAVEGDGTRLLSLRPRTGRTHQLRLQLAARGAPILGDDLYPEPRPEPPLPLQLLARRLSFTDPVTGDARDLRSRQDLDPDREDDTESDKESTAGGRSRNLDG